MTLLLTTRKTDSFTQSYGIKALGDGECLGKLELAWSLPRLLKGKLDFQLILSKIEVVQRELVPRT